MPELTEVTARLTITDIAALGTVGDGPPIGARHPRPQLGVPFEAAPEGLPAADRRAWADALGLEPGRPGGTLLELGGNSLLAVGP